MKKNMSRRSFLKGSAVTAAGMFAGSLLHVGALAEGEQDGVLLTKLGGTGVVTLTNDAKTEYDGIYDVVVVGAGAAGLSSALEAARAGSSVLVVEHEAGVIQSNTALSGGVVMGCCSRVQKEAGVEDDPVEFRKYLAAVGAGYEDPDIMDVWANESGGTVDWLLDEGVTFPVEKLYMSGNETSYEHVTKAVPRGCITSMDSGTEISQVLYARCQEAGVNFTFQTTASRLITDQDGRVVGVVTDKGTFRGNKAVILCTAGFSRNMEWIKSFKPDLTTGGSFGSSYQQGDGIKMGMAVGAKIGNMWITQADTIGTQLTEEMCPCMVIAIWKLPCIFVSQDGKRHMAEDLYYEYQCGEIAAQEGGYVWSIWDQTITDMGSSVITVPACSDGCETEIANGTMFRADTIAELAPHFYTNCLKNAYYMLQLKEYDALEQFLLCLSTHLRYLLQPDKLFVTLREERAFVENYVELQRQLTQREILCAIHIDDADLDLLIPILALQTFVENSVKYAMHDGLEQLRIWLKVTRLRGEDGETLNISYADRGAGYPQEVLEMLNSRIPTDHEGLGVGIVNLLKRCRFHYGEAVSWGFYNDHGAVSELILPIDHSGREETV